MGKFVAAVNLPTIVAEKGNVCRLNLLFWIVMFISGVDLWNEGVDFVEFLQSKFCYIEVKGFWCLCIC